MNTQTKHHNATVLAVISKISAGRLAELRVLNCQGWNVIGTVAIPQNHGIPSVGVIAEVRYDHAKGSTRSLQGASFVRRRDDVEYHECVLSQLKYPGSDK